VCVVDVDGLETPSEIDRFYVALTRPRAGLWVALPDHLTDRIAELTRSNSVSAATLFERTTP